MGHDVCLCSAEISHLQSTWHSAREELMGVRNTLEKQQAVEREIIALNATNEQLGQDIAAADEAKEPLQAKAEQLKR